MHLHSGNKDHAGGYIGKHGQAGGHIIGLVADKGIHQVHGHIRSPEHKVVDKQPQRIQKVDQDQMPVPLKIHQHPAVFFAVVREILMDLRPLQHRRQKKTDGQCQQHTVRNTHPQNKVKKQRKQKGDQHADEKIQRDQPVFLTDGQVEHIVKYQHQSDKAAVSGKHVVNRHTAHQMLPETKGNGKEAAEADIHQHSHPVAGQDILISLFKDHV